MSKNRFLIIIVIQLSICCVFTYLHFRLKTEVTSAEQAINKESKRSDSLNKILEKLNHEYLLETQDLSSSFARQTIPKESVSPSPTGLAKKNPLTVDPSKTPQLPRDPPGKKLSGTSVIAERISKYQCNLTRNMIKLNEFENIMLTTALINLNSFQNSYFSVQEVYEDKDGENASKMIYFDCVKTMINNDSTFQIRFTEKANLNVAPLDPVSYNKNIAVVLNGRINRSSIICTILWNDIAGRPQQAQFGMKLIN